MQCKEYLRNRKEVFKIYGIKRQKNDHMTAHHIVYKSEGGTNEKSNLYPMTDRQQCLFHNWADDRDNGIVEPIPPELREVGKNLG